MNDIITEPGVYLCRNGARMDILAKRGGWWIGNWEYAFQEEFQVHGKIGDAIYCFFTWRSDGRAELREETPWDIVSKAP